jgi:L-ascorbate metabolism protein UlaG (beta-lactamase superfamily)
VRLERFRHSCIRLDGPGGRLVIDPGGLSPDEAVDGADAVLVTHEHFDHFSEGRLRAAVENNRAMQIWTIAAVAELLSGLGSQLHVVGDGDAFTAAGFEVEAHGTWHAEIHRDIPRVKNTGFLVDHSLFHPGDALTVPETPVDTLMVPVHAPWSRIADVIDWIRELAPRRAVAAHDGALNCVGLDMVDGLLGEHGPSIGAEYVTLRQPTTSP